MTDTTYLGSLYELKNLISEISLVLKMDPLSSELVQLDYQEKYKYFTDNFSIKNLEILLINLKRNGYKIQDLFFFLKEVNQLKNTYISKEKSILSFISNQPFSQLQFQLIENEYAEKINNLNSIIDENPNQNSHELNARTIIEKNKIQFELSTKYILENYYEKIIQITNQVINVFYEHLSPDQIYFEKIISEELFNFLINHSIIENDLEKEQFHNFINLLPYTGTINIMKMGKSNSKTKINTFYKIIYTISCILKKFSSNDVSHWDAQLIENLSMDYKKYQRKRKDSFGKKEVEFPIVLKDIILP